MKVLINCFVPFSIAHGGAQIQIEQTINSLQRIGVDVEPVRWWDASQTGDILHHCGRLPSDLVRLARAKGLKVITADLLTAQGSRPMWKLATQGKLNALIRHLSPETMAARFGWHAYTEADACVALTPWEAKLMTLLFNAPEGQVEVVPNGVEREFLDSTKIERGPWLVCTATVTERKRVLEVAQAAVIAQTPLWIIGRSYSSTDPYGQRFLEFAKANPNYIRYDGAIGDRLKLAQIYREARGFVLLSTMESLSLSALEAAACECPLLLSALPWAKTVFKDTAMYAPITSPQKTAAHLRQFYDKAPTCPRPERPLSWDDVAVQFRSLYEKLLKTSR
jgi:glycosyltransferase involved in cell wall biosynthesis